MVVMPTTPGRIVYQSPRCAVTFDYDFSGMAKCAMGPELEAAVLHLAENVAKPYAISISPRSNRAGPDHYQDSFVVIPATTTIKNMRRVAALLLNTSMHAAAVEWGNNRIRHPHRVLTKTLDHLNTLGHDHNPEV